MKRQKNQPQQPITAAVAPPPPAAPTPAPPEAPNVAPLEPAAAEQAAELVDRLSGAVAKARKPGKRVFACPHCGGLTEIERG